MEVECAVQSNLGSVDATSALQSPVRVAGTLEPRLVDVAQNQRADCLSTDPAREQTVLVAEREVRDKELDFRGLRIGGNSDSAALTMASHRL